MNIFEFVYLYVDAPQAITGDRVNRECYMQVRGRVHNSHLGACFCVDTLCHTGRLRTLPARAIDVDVMSTMHTLGQHALARAYV